MNKTFSLLLILIALLFTMAACSGVDLSEPSPIPPPPNLDEIDTTDPEPIDPTGSPESISDEVDEPEAEAENTALPAETATSDAVATPTLAPTAVPNTIPPIQSVSEAGLPKTSRDLVFIGDGSLKLYTDNGQLIELISGGQPAANAARSDIFTPFEGDVTHFDVSADGNRIVAARVTRTETVTNAADDTDQSASQIYTEHEVLFIDVVSKETWVLAQNVTDLTNVSVSPNQQTAAFIGSGLVPESTPEFSADPPELNIYTVLTPDRGDLKQVVDCDAICHSLVWHLNSELFFYSDDSAMWLYNLSASQPERILDNQTDDLANYKVYSPISFASNGRYLLLWDGVWEGGRRAVYDIPTQQLIPIPNTSVTTSPFRTEVTWMPDTRLLVTHNRFINGSWEATLELWRLAVENGSVNLEESTTPPQTGAAVGTINLENGRFAYAIVDQDSVTDSGLYLQTSFTEPNDRVNGITPAFAAPEVIWSPDGFGAIFLNGTTPYYGQANGSLVDLSGEFGRFTHSFRWLPQTAVER